MTARLREQTRFCPILNTQYIQNPKLSTLTTNYLPGYRINVLPSTTCLEAPESPEYARVRPLYIPRTLVVPKSINVTFIIQGPQATYTYTNRYRYTDTITDLWAVIRYKVFELYGNVPVRPGILESLQSQATGIIYSYGSPLPNTGGIFTPKVTFT
jgi:hypothetical protein